MENDTKYKLERKAPKVLPRFLCRWKTLDDDLDFDEVEKHIKERRHFALLRVNQSDKSTIVEFVETPNWSTEQYESHRHGNRFGPSPSIEENVFYRVTPPIKISFEEY